MRKYRVKYKEGLYFPQTKTFVVWYDCINLKTLLSLYRRGIAPFFQRPRVSFETKEAAEKWLETLQWFDKFHPNTKIAVNRMFGENWAKLTLLP